MAEDRGAGSESGERKRPGRLVLASIAVLVVGAGLWFLIAKEAAAPDSAGSPPSSSPPPVSAPPPVAAAPPAAPAPPAGPLPEDPVEAYKARTRYAPGSGRIGAEASDLLYPNRRYERPLPIRESYGRPENEVVTVHFEADHYYYESDDDVVATLHVKKGDAVWPVVITKAQVVAEDGSGAVGDPEPLTFRLVDGEPQTTLRLEDEFAEHHGTLLLTVEFEWEPGLRKEVELRIFSTPIDRIPARFTNEHSDTVRNGSLVFLAGIDVDTPGFYRLDANLFSANGSPLAFASFKGDLEAGQQQVPLEFFGLLLHDIGVPGPYEVRNLRGYLFRDGMYPDRLRMRDAAGVHYTRPYDLAGFSQDEFTSEHKQRMIELLEQDVQAGIAVASPPSAAGP